MDSVSSFLNVKGVSEYLALKKSAVYFLVETKQIPHYRVGRQVRFKKSDIDAWMEEHKEPAVDTKIETKKVFRSIEKKADMDLNRIIKRVVEQSKKKGYNLSQEKPGRIKDLGKEAEDGII
jgi:excisionase family DNA binding protein